MEHLPIHLPFEAMVGGPVQYRWMYPFERFLYHLKKKVRNKVHVEASIIESYIIEETSTFVSFYFEPNVQTKLNQPPRNYDGGDVEETDHLDIFNKPGHPLGKVINEKLLSEDEYKAIDIYALLNCDDIAPFVEKFDEYLWATYSNMNDEKLEKIRNADFAQWLKDHVQDLNNLVDYHVKAMAYGPFKGVRYYNGYFINGYKFHTFQYGQFKTTMNSGACVLGNSWNSYEQDYYGIINQVLEVEYAGRENNLVFFRCQWFDTGVGTRVHPKYGTVQINRKRKLASNEPFVLAHQAHQVYYVPSSSKNRIKLDWMMVCKMKSRNVIDVSEIENVEAAFPNNDDVLQHDDIIVPQPVHMSIELDDSNIVNQAGELVEVSHEGLRIFHQSQGNVVEGMTYSDESANEYTDSEEESEDSNDSEETEDNMDSDS